MKLFKYLLALIYLTNTFNLMAQQPLPLEINKCYQFIPYGQPVIPSNINYVLRCRMGYFLASDLDAKIPVYTVYLLTPEHSIGCIKRSNSFSTDNSLPVGERAENKDYENSGFDKGHMSPDGDMSWNVQTEQDSFILSNMSPQLPNLNRIVWRLLELDIRNWAKERNHNLLIYTGPVYDNKINKHIGIDNVDIPTGFYKIIVDTVTNEVISFYFPAEYSKPDVSSGLTNISNIEGFTKLVIPLPANYTQSTSLWSLDIKAYNLAKKEKCKVK